MKNLLALFIGLGLFQSVGLADHQKLKALTKQVGYDASRLVNESRRVIGSYPTYRQRYAYEHVSFLHRSAHRFETAVFSRDLDDRDHASYVKSVYRSLEHDAQHARETFEDLFSRDHASDYKLLNGLLTNIERDIKEIAAHLP